MSLFRLLSPSPGPFLGLLAHCTTTSAPTGQVEGHIVEVEMFYPLVGGLPYQGGIWGGLSGAKITGPITNGWVALNDLQKVTRLGMLLR